MTSPLLHQSYGKDRAIFALNGLRWEMELHFTEANGIVTS